MKIKYLFIGFVLCMVFQYTYGQTTTEAKKPQMLINDPQLRIDIVLAINDMYNFQFDKAEQQYDWFMQKYPEHPMPYFLKALNTWWKILPHLGLDYREHDAAFLNYLDQTIYYAERLKKTSDDDIEAFFFLSAAYAFKGRIHGERKNWAKAIGAVKNAITYLHKGEELNQNNIELMFGRGLYNYYAVWLPNEYAMLKPVMALFKKGDKTLGLEQLKNAALNAFYTQTEAQYFLTEIYRNEENKPQEAFHLTEYLHKTYPENACFHRDFTVLCFTLGKYELVEPLSYRMLERLQAQQIGYNGIDGRYANYFLGYLEKTRGNKEKSYDFFLKAMDFAEKINAYEYGYYHSTLYNLADYAMQEKNYLKAALYYNKLKKYAKKDTIYYKDAKKFFQEHGKDIKL
ncbi:MAG: tol-pal system protein YbgF [Cytophagales bacterium]|nr:MAG: tol-pal system protein YbgF [Cytophagales bacterium]